MGSDMGTRNSIASNKALLPAAGQILRCAPNLPQSAVLVAPSMSATQSSISPMRLFAALTGACLATYVIHLVASAIRKRKSIEATNGNA